MTTESVEDLRLLVRLVRRDVAGVERRLRARTASLDHLVETAIAHNLSVVLLRAIEKTPIHTALSRTHLETMETRRRRHETRAQILLDALVALADRFASADQPFIVLKGSYHAARFYGDVYGREFIDLDLLVPRADRMRVFGLLAAAGYKRRSRVLLSAKLTGFFVHGFDFSAGSAYVDLHWCLSRHPSLRLDDSQIWDQRQSYSVNGRSYAVLSDKHEVVFGALSLLRDLGAGKAKLIKIVDLIQVVAATDATIDWDAFFESSRCEGTFGPLVNILTFCIEAADAQDLTPRLTAALSRYADRRVAVPAAVSPLRFRPIRFGLGNRFWAARSYDTTSACWFLWWGVSLPFRMAVYRWRRP